MTVTITRPRSFGYPDDPPLTAMELCRRWLTDLDEIGPVNSLADAYARFIDFCHSTPTVGDPSPGEWLDGMIANEVPLGSIPLVVLAREDEQDRTGFDVVSGHHPDTHRHPHARDDR